MTQRHSRESHDDGALGRRLREVLRSADRPSDALREQGIVAGIPEVAALADTPQDPLWHPEGDVLVHSLWAADLAARHAIASSLAVDDRERLVLACLWHDIGKPSTTRRREGRITSYGHAERGAEIVRDLGMRLGLPGSLTRAVAALTATHMAHASVRGEPSARAVRRLAARLQGAGASLEEWAVVVQCDGRARGAAARPDASASWIRVAEGAGIPVRRA